MTLPNMSDDVRRLNAGKLGGIPASVPASKASSSNLPKLKENDVKLAIKNYLAVRRIFNYPLLQALGAYKGIPDRILHVQGRVIYLEIKRPGGKQSAYQLAFERQCLTDGITYWCVASVEELQALLSDAP